MAGIVLSGALPREEEIIKKKIIELKGTMSNSGAIYEINITIGSPSSTLVTETKSTFKGLMCISKDGQTIEVMEREVDKKKIEFYEIKRVPANSDK